MFYYNVQFQGENITKIWQGGTKFSGRERKTLSENTIVFHDPVTKNA